MKIDMSQVAELGVILDRASGSVGAKTSLVLRKTAFDIEADAKFFAPVDTGALESSISTDIIGDGRHGYMAAEIGPTVEYGIYQEYGTSTQPGKSFMRPAFDRRRPGFEAAMGRIATEGL